MKKHSSDKISVKETFRLSLKAYRLLWKVYPQIFITSAACSVVGAVIPYVEIWLSAQLISELAGGRSIQRLTGLVLAILFYAMLSDVVNTLILSRIRDYYKANQWKLQQKIYSDKMLDMDFCDVDKQHTHDLFSQIQQNQQWTSWGIPRMLGYFESILSALTNLASATVLTVGLFTQAVPTDAGMLTVLNNPIFVLFLIAILFGVTFLAPILGNKANAYWNRRDEEARFGNRVFGYFGHTLFHRHERALDLRMYRQDTIGLHYAALDKHFSTQSAICRAARGPMGLLNAASAMVSVSFTGVVYLFVCLKAWAGAFGVGAVTQYISAISSLSGSVSWLIGTVGNMRANARFLQTEFEFLDIPNQMYQGSLSVEKRRDRNYVIEFRDVSFMYPGADTWALRHMNMKFRVGQRMAVVGQNGSGKTTFIKLLCRLYDPTEGEILLNGINIRKYNYREYMSIFSVVFQDFQLLAYSLGQNVAASRDFDRQRAEDCLREAGFGDRLDEMENGLDTILYKHLDDKGVEISGGEAQKIALARALYKNTPFIILDEPTAALDPLAEYEVYSKFDEIVDDKTAIYISHRLSSCRFCDTIAVFDNGQVVQQGSHGELVADESGLYYSLWNAQAQYYVNE